MLAVVRPCEKTAEVHAHLSGQTPDESKCVKPNQAPAEGKLGLVPPDAWTVKPASAGYDPACPNTASRLFL